MAFAKMSALRERERALTIAFHSLRSHERGHVLIQMDSHSLTEQVLSSTCQDVQLCKVKESARCATRGPAGSRPR